MNKHILSFSLLMLSFSFFSCIASIFTQFALHQNASASSDLMTSVSRGAAGIQSAEATCLSLCSLAEQHADRVSYTEEIFIKFPFFNCVNNCKLSGGWVPETSRSFHH